MTPLKRNLWIAGSVVFFVLLLDQIVKVWVKTSFVPGASVPVFGDWFNMLYIENQGMAFGQTFGSNIWAKLGLSLFRMVAIVGIGYYWVMQAKKGARVEFLIAIGFVFAGAAGNLIDSMFYDFFFDFKKYQCLSFNDMEGSGNFVECFPGYKKEVRHTGFLLGSVVDMFQFDMRWPQWVPWLGGGEVFPAIWNIADGSITVGVLMILVRQRVYFRKTPAVADTSSADQSAEETPE